MGTLCHGYIVTLTTVIFEAVQQNLADKMACDIGAFKAKRIGKEGSKPRPILVEFNSIWDRRKMYASRIKMSKTDDLKSIYMNEDLEKTQAEIFYLARRAKKDKLIRNTWTYGGITYILKDSDVPVAITSTTQLRHIVPGLPGVAAK